MTPDGSKRRIAGWIAVLLAPVWVLYLFISGATVTGPGRWVAAWEGETFGTYYPRVTMEAFVAAGLVGALLLLALARRLLPEPSGARGARPVSAAKVTAVLAACLLLVGVAAGVSTGLAYRDQAAIETVDLARGQTPHAPRVTLIGVAQTADMAISTQIDRTGNRNSERFIPVTEPNWQQGDPVHVLLRTTEDGITNASGAHVAFSSAPSLSITQQGTVVENGMPATIRSALAQNGIVLAEPVAVVDPGADAWSSGYAELALAALLAAAVVGAVSVLLRRR